MDTITREKIYGSRGLVEKISEALKAKSGLEELYNKYNIII